jgi:hypothetical protein
MDFTYDLRVYQEIDSTHASSFSSSSSSSSASAKAPAPPPSSNNQYRFLFVYRHIPSNVLPGAVESDADVLLSFRALLAPHNLLAVEFLPDKSFDPSTHRPISSSKGRIRSAGTRKSDPPNTIVHMLRNITASHDTFVLLVKNINEGMRCNIPYVCF